MHLALYYYFAIWVAFKLQITMECYIMFIFSKLIFFSMALWLMQGKHGLRSFPLDITWGMLHHKILVWNIFCRLTTMPLENVDLEKSFPALSIQAISLLLGISLSVAISTVWTTRNLEKIVGCAKNELSQRPHKTSCWYFTIVSNSTREASHRTSLWMSKSYRMALLLHDLFIQPLSVQQFHLTWWPRTSVLWQ